MKYLAIFNLWFLRWDREFARYTGRGPQHIAELTGAIHEWERVLWESENSLGR
jgi:hypothetical protein